MGKTLVSGAGGFVGGWLVKSLLSQGDEVLAIDRKPLNNWYQLFDNASNECGDLSDISYVRDIFASYEITSIFNLAADMGGMGFIENNKALCMASAPIHLNLLRAVSEQKINLESFFFSSSACVYRQDLQLEPEVVALREDDAYPADPEDGYGWEKLFNERASRHYYEDFGIPVSIGRYHNVYGPHGTWFGGREKAPAAIARKIAAAKILGGDYAKIQIWGDGTQTRSFTYIDDAISGTQLLAKSGFRDPLNIGSSELVSINELVNMFQEIAQTEVSTTHILDAPKGVAGRNSDNSKCREVLNGWEPRVELKTGMKELFDWVENEFLGQLNRGTSVESLMESI